MNAVSIIILIVVAVLFVLAVQGSRKGGCDGNCDGCGGCGKLTKGGKPMKEEKFTWWKHPWQKWLLLAAGLLQLPCLWMNIQEYQRISAAGILSASEWAGYSSKQMTSCTCNALAAACFLGAFFIGLCARSEKTALLAGTVFLSVLTVAWGVAGCGLHLFSVSLPGLFYAFILLLLLGGAVYSLLKYRKTDSR